VCVFTSGPAAGGTNRAIGLNSGILSGRDGVARCSFDRTRSRVVENRLTERVFALGDDAVHDAIAGDVANSALTPMRPGAFRSDRAVTPTTRRSYTQGAVAVRFMPTPSTFPSSIATWRVRRWDSAAAIRPQSRNQHAARLTGRGSQAAATRASGVILKPARDCACLKPQYPSCLIENRPNP